MTNTITDNTKFWHEANRWHTRKTTTVSKPSALFDILTTIGEHNL